MIGRLWKQHQIEDLLADEVLYIGDGYRAKNDELSDVGRSFTRGGNIDNGFHFEGADRFPEKDLENVGEGMATVPQ